MADKKIKIEVDLDAEPSIAQLKKLKLALKETAAGSAEFAILQQQINDTEDAINAAKTGASNFTEVLGQLPGPIGEIGNKVSGAVNTLKQFGALKFSDLKTSFVELGKDLGDAAKGLGKLTGITKAYTALNGFLAKSFQAVGVAEGAAATGARALSAALIATGIGALVVLLATAASALYEMATGEEEAAEAAETLNKALERQNELLELNAADTNRRNKVELARLKAQGADAKTIRETQFKQSKEIYEQAYKDEQEAIKIYNDNLGKADVEGLKKLEDNLSKKQQATKNAYANAQEVGYNNKAEELKEEETKNKELSGKSKALSDKRIAEKQREIDELKKLKEQELKDIQKNEKEAVLSLLDIRDQERRKIIDDYRIKLDLAAKNGYDTSILEEAKLKALQELNDKYKKEDDEKAEELKAKEREAAFEKLQTQIDDLTAENDLVDDDFQQDLERLELKREKLNEQKEIELSNLKLTEAERIKIIAKYAKQEQDIDKSVTATKKAELAAKKAIQMQYADFVQQFGNLLSSAAGKNKTLAIAGIIIEQGAALAKVIMSTQTANAAALATPQAVLTSGASAIPVIIRNNIQGALSAAAIVIGAVKGIASINSAQIPGGSGSGGSASGGGAEMPAYNSGMAMNTPQINTTGGANPATQISQTIQNAQSGPIKAYVVSGDITSQQQLERKANRGATFNLG